jgi:uncharacterized protein YciI
MATAKRFACYFVLHCIVLGVPDSFAQAPPSTEASSSLPLFAVQVRVGPKWDASKPPHEQALFREHSANLKRLRDAGHLIVGARFSDIGLIVLAADSETSARAMIDADPSIAAGTFTYEIHPMNVFYPGTLQGAAVRKSP